VHDQATAAQSSKIQLTKLQTTHCFPAIPDYIAPQRVWFARSFGRASFLGILTPVEFQVLSAIRKSGSRFSGEIALQPLSDPEETT
jgi:hypothetical protein